MITTTANMMMCTKQICIVGYVIAIILILSNTRFVVSSNENNQYATATASATTAKKIVARTPAAITTTKELLEIASPTSIPSTQPFHIANEAATVTAAKAKATFTATSNDMVMPAAMMSMTMRSVSEIKSINALKESNSGEFMQQTLHNNHHEQHQDTIGLHGQTQQQHSSKDIVQHDAENLKQLLQSSQQQSNPNNHAERIIESNRNANSAPTISHRNHDQFMNENEMYRNENVPGAIESNVNTMNKQQQPTPMRIGNQMENTQRNTPNEATIHTSNSNSSSSTTTTTAIPNHNNNDNSPRKSDEITSMPMKIVRDNVNATSETVFRADNKMVMKENETLADESAETISDFSEDEFGGVTSPMPAKISDRTDRYVATSTESRKFDERSRYLETDLNFNDEVHETSDEPTDDNINDRLAWPSDVNKFEELTLSEDDGIDDDDDATLKTANTETQLWTLDAPSSEMSIRPTTPSSGNIYKVKKPNKSKAVKRLAGQPPQSPQALHEIRLNKSPAMSNANEKQFINSHSFQYIISLYDQYEWNIDFMRNGLSRKCVNDMDIYLEALYSGKIWAAQASDAAGRYRGQFLYDNNNWLGSLVVCNELEKIDALKLSFYVAVVSIRSPEPMMKNHMMHVGQCLPRSCSTDDVKFILNVDTSARKFKEAFANATNPSNKGEIVALNVRRVPGGYDFWKDRLFYLVIFICSTFAGLAIWATVYEHSLLSMENNFDDDNLSFARQAIHVVHKPTPLPTIQKTNGQRIYPMYEKQQQIDLESTEPALKKDKNHTNNIINGCTFELHPIQIENNNGNHMTNNNNHNNKHNRTFYRLNNNNRNGININNNHNNGNHNDHDGMDNMKTLHHHNHQRNGSSFQTKTFDDAQVLNDLSIPQRLLLSFSLSSNAKTILSTKRLPQDSIGCIHGIRVFSMMWIIIVHTYLQTFAIAENRYSRKVSERSFIYQFVGNASYTVDTFFYISGFLVTLLFLRTSKSPTSKTTKESGFFDGIKQSLMLFFYRYIRLTPAYFMVIIINTVTLRYVYNWSVFAPGLPDHLTCPNYWWRNILYIQTWFPFSQLCMLWAWYLADDMQFYLWAIPLLILSKRHGKAAVTIIATFLLASWIVSALVSLNFNYTHKVAEPLESFGYLYEKPWCRLGPYVMGMITGYILNRYKSAPAFITPFVNLLLWVMSLAVLLLLVFGVWNGTLDRAWTALYVSVGHTAWGLALMWITLSCKWGLAEPIDKLLSHHSLLPLSRLTYCAYLIHPVSQIAMSLELKGTVHIQHGLILTIFLGNAITAYAIALILSLLFEAPVVRVLKIAFGK